MDIQLPVLKRGLFEDLFLVINRLPRLPPSSDITLLIYCIYSVFLKLFEVFPESISVHLLTKRNSGEGIMLGEDPNTLTTRKSAVLVFTFCLMLSAEVSFACKKEATFSNSWYLPITAPVSLALTSASFVGDIVFRTTYYVGGVGLVCVAPVVIVAGIAGGTGDGTFTQDYMRNCVPAVIDAARDSSKKVFGRETFTEATWRRTKKMRCPG